MKAILPIFLLLFHFRSPVTHRMAPWVHRVFIDILPKILCIERPKKDDNDEQQHEVLTDVNVFQVPPDVDKYGYCGNRFTTDYDIPGTYKKFS